MSILKILYSYLFLLNVVFLYLLQVLSCRTCIDPATFGRRFDPWGEYIRRYVPELAKYPVEYIYEPWLAPKMEQARAGCVVGKDYPERIVIHEDVSVENMAKMDELKKKIMQKLNHL